MPKSLITTVPFGDKNRLPIELLENAKIEYLINPLNKKLTEDELVDMDLLSYEDAQAGAFRALLEKAIETF